MSAIIEAFKIKPFELEPIYDSWPSAPMFYGNPSRDMPVDDWLEQITQGCEARRVPKEYWHKVAQHYLGPNAKARFDELKAVMRNMHGGKYTWNWKRFKVAMRNMGWEIDSKKTEEIEVQRKPSGLWWVIGKREKKEKDSDSISITSVTSTTSSVNKDLPTIPAARIGNRPVPKKSMTWDFSTFKGNFPTPKRTATSTSIETLSVLAEKAAPPLPAKPTPTRSNSIFSSALTTPALTPDITPASTPGGDTTQVAHAPTWLVNASQALSFLTNEHPKAMTAISAVLITIGSVPAIPAIAAGAGGAFLASGTAQAIGSIAIGVGSMLKAISDVQAPPAQEAKELQ